MRSRRTALLGAALAALLAAAPARADLLYHWSITPGPDLAAGPGRVTFALAPDGRIPFPAPEMLTPTFAIPAAEVSTRFGAGAAPARFDHAPYALTLRLTDTRFHLSASVTFSGTIDGTLTASGASLTDTLSGPLTQRLELTSGPGEVSWFFDYLITLSPGAAALGGPGAPPAQVGAGVFLQGAGVASGVPEPSGLLLAVLGLAAGSCPWLRRCARGPAPGKGRTPMPI